MKKTIYQWLEWKNRAYKRFCRQYGFIEWNSFQKKWKNPTRINKRNKNWKH